MTTETNNSTALREQVEALRHMTVGQLKDKYRDVFGESTRSNHKQFLFRRIAAEVRERLLRMSAAGLSSTRRMATGG